MHFSGVVFLGVPFVDEGNSYKIHPIVPSHFYGICFGLLFSCFCSHLLKVFPTSGVGNRRDFTIEFMALIQGFGLINVFCNWDLYACLRGSILIGSGFLSR